MKNIMQHLRKLITKKFILTTLFGSGFLVFIFFSVMAIIIVVVIGGSQNQSNNNNTGYEGGLISEIGKKEIPEQFIQIYKDAEGKYGVMWNLLAAIHRVETNFSTIDPMISSVGAEGHMQFMPCTFVGWGHPTCSGSGKGHISEADKKDPTIIKKYGGYGVDANNDGIASMWNIEDAIFTTASMLASNGVTSGNIEDAIFSYNHSPEYVNDVLYYMELYASGYTPIGSENTDFILPYSSSGFVVTSNYGGRELGYHTGIDLSSGIGTPIHSIGDGVIVEAYSTPINTYGKYITIKHYNGYYSRYAHLSEVSVSVGDEIKQGGIIGKEGNTGRSTGPHLHFEIRRANDYNKGTSIDPRVIFPSLPLPIY